MKTLFTAFANFMDRLGNNDHVVKCAWIFMCTVFTCGIATIPMLINYRNLWTFTGPQLEAVKTPTARQPVVYRKRLGLKPISVQDDPKRSW